MKELSVFDFTYYREYLKSAIPAKGKDRGSRTRLAELLGCQGAFISQVFSGLGNFSLEHAMIVSRFLRHSKEEREYFLLLIQHERAGSKELRDHFAAQIDAILARRRDISTRVATRKSGLTDLDKQLYYSSWHYIAVHLCLVIPGMQNKKATAEYLGLSEERVSQIIADLVRSGLVRLEGSKYIGNYDRVHLPTSSPLVSKHHSNWRMRSIQSFDSPEAKDLHYSLVMSVSQEASETMRKRILALIQEFEPILREAKDEEVMVFSADFFSLRA